MIAPRGGEGAVTDTTQGGATGGGDHGDDRVAQASSAEIEAAVALSPLMARVDVAVAAIVALSAATLTVAMPMLIASGGIEPGRDYVTLSPVLIPRLAFGCLTILAIFALISAVQTVRSGIGRPRADEVGRLERAGVAALIALGYAATVTWLGYILATMLMTVVMAYYLGLRNPLMFIPGVVVIPVAIRFVFERLLLISLPRSSIESVGLVEDAVMRFLVRIFTS